MLVNNKPKNFTDCVTWARHYFEKQYAHQILQLLYNFPPDQLTSTGAKFWSGPKRCPRAAKFDLQDETHRAYLVSLAYLRAELYALKLPQETEVDWTGIINGMTIEEFTPKSGVKIAANDSEAQQEAQQQ